jgi:superfamily I DNA/RNA helicase
MHGPAPEVQQFASRQDQVDEVLRNLRMHDLPVEACCVVARTRKELMELKSLFESCQQNCHQLDGRSGNTPEGSLNLATMHRVKGLEFDAVFVLSVNKGFVPLDYVVNSAADAVTRRQRENEERALLYVSLTRARKLAFVYGYGVISEWFQFT